MEKLLKPQTQLLQKEFFHLVGLVIHIMQCISQKKPERYNLSGSG